MKQIKRLLAESLALVATMSLILGTLPVQALADDSGDIGVEEETDAGGLLETKDADIVEIKAEAGEGVSEEPEVNNDNLTTSEDQENGVEAADSEDIKLADVQETVDAPFYIVHTTGFSYGRSINIGIMPYSTLQQAVNAAVSGDTIYITDQTVTLDSALIISSASGLSITFAAAGEAVASGVTIVSAEDVRHIMVSGTGNITLTFNNVTLDGGNRSGGINTTASLLTLTNVVVRNCYSSISGGGIYSFSDLKITGDSVISGNTAYFGGGGVCVADSTFEMTGGTISDNTGDLGGGVYLNSQGTFNMYGGAISGNTANTAGGGVYVPSENSSFTMIGGVISGNTASTFGGGVRVHRGTLTMNGGTISDNTANYGGGIHVYISGTVEILGSSVISGNTAVRNGGGIFTEDTTYANLKTSSGTVFFGNTAAKLYETPVNADTLYPNMKYASVSPAVFSHPLNNYDINYNASTAYYYLTVEAGAGGTITTGTSGYYAGGSTVAIAAFANSGYDFESWNSDNSVTFADASSANTTFTMPSADVAITASFVSTPGITEYKLTYDAGGGEGGRTNTNLEDGSEYTVLGQADTGITRDGYTFKGWNTKADGSGTVYAAGDTITVTEDVTLYAQWEETVTDLQPTYTVTYNANGGEGDSVVNPHYEGMSVTLAANTFTAPDGYAFKGWNTKADGSGTAYAAGDTITITGDVTLYAQWVKTNVQYKFTTLFDTFTGSGARTGTVNGAYAKFVRLLIDGEELSSSNYTIAEGSTVVTLNESYLKTLENGTYTVTAEYTDGSAGTVLTVNVSSTMTSGNSGTSGTSGKTGTSSTASSARTGDSSNMALWSVLLFVSLTGAVYLLWTVRRIRQHRAKH